jgi:hypothetical protein
VPLSSLRNLLGKPEYSTNLESQENTADLETTHCSLDLAMSIYKNLILQMLKCHRRATKSRVFATRAAQGVYASIWNWLRMEMKIVISHNRAYLTWLLSFSPRIRKLEWLSRQLARDLGRLASIRGLLKR